MPEDSSQSIFLTNEKYHAYLETGRLVEDNNAEGKLIVRFPEIRSCFLVEKALRIEGARPLKKIVYSLNEASPNICGEYIHLNSRQYRFSRGFLLRFIGFE